LTTLAFALGRLSLRGSVSTAVGSVVGGAFLGGAMGMLALTTRSLLATMTARMVSLYSASLFDSTHLGSTGSLRCPHCEARIVRQSLTAVSSFECSACHTSLRISRGYSVAARILASAAALATCILWGRTGGNFSSLILMFVLVFLLTYMPFSLVVTKLFPPQVQQEMPNELQLPK
jgi:hypothetical protein